jgi:hypothetical protein
MRRGFGQGVPFHPDSNQTLFYCMLARTPSQDAARGIEYGFSPLTHPDDFSNQDLRRGTREIASRVLEQLPAPGSPEAEHLMAQLSKSGDWYFRRKQRLDPKQSEFQSHTVTNPACEAPSTRRRPRRFRGALKFFGETRSLAHAIFGACQTVKLSL